MSSKKRKPHVQLNPEVLKQLIYEATKGPHKHEPASFFIKRFPISKSQFYRTVGDWPGKSRMLNRPRKDASTVAKRIKKALDKPGVAKLVKPGSVKPAAVPQTLTLVEAQGEYRRMADLLSPEKVESLTVGELRGVAEAAGFKLEMLFTA